MYNGEHSKMHWGCCGRWVVGMILWKLALLSFLGGIIAFWRGGEFYSISVMTWYWTALVGGVLALGKKGSGCGCGGGCCSNGTCGTSEVK